MSTTLTLAPAADLLLHPEPFALEHDDPLPQVELAFEIGPELIGVEGPSAAGTTAPLIVVQGGISAHPHVTEHPRDPSRGWWSDLVGPGRALDTRRFRVVALEFLGRRQPRTVSSGDQARATALLLDELGVPRLHAFVGASYGGMVALRFAELFPDRVERVVAISAPDRSRVFATAWRSLQRRVLELGRVHGALREAVTLARAMGMLSYRSPVELEERFAGPPSRRPAADPDGAFVFPVEEYLAARGGDFARHFDAGALARLSLAIDLHAVDVARIRAATTLVAADPDLLVPAAQLEALVPRFTAPARCVRLPSRFGHDAFLKETAALAPILRSALEDWS